MADVQTIYVPDELINNHVPDPDCGWCEGTGERFGHSLDCTDPFCTPGVHCEGTTKRCLCNPRLMFVGGPPRCWYCGAEFDAKHGPRGATVDHKHPRSRGGGDDPRNLVHACRSCNSSKGARTVEEYRAALSRKRGYKVVFGGEESAQDG